MVGIKILKKEKRKKKAPGYIIILHLCTKNHDHNYAILFLRYDAWRM